ncbi:hypothetical protein BC628DRAFT_1102149 [Trametes gibbosa]|nr:hypothetical protein BC628DRAFT_1102149 [Trametes gibbosa]
MTRAARKLDHRLLQSHVTNPSSGVVWRYAARKCTTPHLPQPAQAHLANLLCALSIPLMFLQVDKNGCVPEVLAARFEACPVTPKPVSRRQAQALLAAYLVRYRVSGMSSLGPFCDSEQGVGKITQLLSSPRTVSPKIVARSATVRSVSCPGPPAQARQPRPGSVA